VTRKVDAAWAIRTRWNQEQRDGSRLGMSKARRAKESPHRLVLFCSFLGSPCGDTARVLCVDRADLLDMATERINLLAPPAIDALLDYVGALWWRQLWRAGDPWAATATAVREVLKCLERLPWIPGEVIRDWTVAAREAGLMVSRRSGSPTPKAGQGRTGSSSPPLRS